MSGNIAITGIPTTPGQDGSLPLRRELRDLQRSRPDEFNLYILGLKALEAQDQSKTTSYYQVAGIHGQPYKPWNGVASTTDWQTSSGFGGYCTHSSILFLSWHRPYLALYEQSLYNAVQEVAKQFPAGALRDKYVQAAKNFRAPYFDWASQPPQGSSVWPSVLSSPNIQVVDVDGKTKSAANPLYRFAFGPAKPPAGDISRQWSRYATTVRYPNRLGQSQDTRIAPILANELASLRSNVGLLLLSYTNFDAFSFNRWDPSTSPGEFGSLEDVHNEIHDRVGGGGHMSALDVSSFDPFFWLHHNNVDRLWAIWQDLNPGSYMSPRPAPYSTFSTRGGESQTKDTPLAPFWDKSGAKFWTSADVKDTAAFGYAYPETQKWRFPGDQQGYQAEIRRAVTALYGTNVFANFVANVARRRDEHAVAVNALAAVAAKEEGVPAVAAVAPPTAQQAQAVFAVMTPIPSAEKEAPAKEEQVPIPVSLAHLAPNNTYTEWVVNVRAQKHGLGGPFRILVFLGDFNTASPATWDTEFNLVGRVSVLARDITPNPTTTSTSEAQPETQSQGRCAKCVDDAASELMVSGTVPLTSALLQDIVIDHEINSLRSEEVVPHLKAKLAWRVTMFDHAGGAEVDANAVPGLKVSVASTEVRIRGEDGLPEYSGEYQVWPEVTEGKAGGLARGEHV